MRYFIGKIVYSSFRLLLNSYRARNKNRLRNSNFTILSNNCVGGIIYHDLGLQFLTPTVDLFFKDLNAFIYFAKNLAECVSCELIEQESDVEYPVGYLVHASTRIELHFMHYSSFAQAKEKWEERSKRINYGNIFIIMEAGTSTSEELLNTFDTIPYKNKVAITNGEHSSDVSFPLNIYDRKYVAGKILSKKSSVNHKRHLDDFDYVAFLNSGKIKRR